MQRLFVLTGIFGCGASGGGAAEAGAATTTDAGTLTTTSAGTTSGSESSGSEGDQAPIWPFGSGSRLRARSLEAPGGAREFYSFLDTELGVLCTFFEVAPDDYRCLPQWSVPPPQRRWVWALPDRAASTPHAYLDPQCTDRAFRFDDCPPSSGEAVVVAPPARECGPRPWPGMPAVFDTPASVAYQRNVATGACESIDLDSDDAVLTYEMIDPSRFVHADLIDEGGARRLVADDGAFVVLYLLDAQGRPCDVVASELDVCVPAISGYYFWENEPNLETSCDEFFGVSNGCDPPSHAVTLDGQEVRAVLGPCPSDGEPVPAWQVGEPIATEDLTTLLRTDVGDGPLTAEYHLDARGEPSRFIRWWDDRSQAECIVRRFGGRWWCYPSSRIERFTWGAYADAACTTEVWVDDGDDPLAIERYVDTGCSEPMPELFEPVPYSGPLYELTDAGCEENGSAVGATAGAPLPLSEVATELELRTE